MIYLRRFNESIENIESICQKYGINNYTINEDGSIDVDGNVNLKNKKLTKLPLKFKNIAGSFDCTYNKLTTLEGAPKSVGSSFYCSDNKLTTLEGAPKYVGGDFYCTHNQLTTLEGASKSVGGHFSCSNNKLFNLEFTPSGISLSCFNNPISNWWSKIDIDKLEAFIDLGIDSRDPDFMNQEKIDLLE